MKNQIITDSLQDKISKARKYKQQNNLKQAVKFYTKAIFLKQEPDYLTELAEVYEKMMDISTAINLLKRAQQLKNSPSPKIKELVLTKGFCLLESGSVNNILKDTEFVEFKQRYPQFHAKLMDLCGSVADIRQNLLNCLAYLETDYRMFSLQQIQKCKQKCPQQIEILILQAFIKWSITKNAEGYSLMWQASQINAQDALIRQFFKLVLPKTEALFKQTQYLLIDNKTEKCMLNIKKGLQLYPTNTNFLIIKAFIHRSKEEYQQALCELEYANKTLKDPEMEAELRNQISLTYNEMGTFLFKKKKYAEAIALFNQGIAFRPTDWGMRANRGDCYKALNDYAKALQDYLVAHHIGGDKDEINFRIGAIFNSRGIAHFNAQNHKQACMQFTEALKYCKKQPQFYINRGKCLLELGRYVQAVVDFQTALKFDPKNQEAANYLNQYKPQEGLNVPKKKVIYLAEEK